MSSSNLKRRGIRLSFLLRHDPSGAIDEHGWREIADLVDFHGYTFDLLCKIVETDNKGRYEFSEDMRLVRARQGHSVPVDVELDEVVPPPLLYHGTATCFVGSIMEKGILKMCRLYVHLSEKEETARVVGKRHGDAVVLCVDAGRMHADGFKFYLSRNGVWLTDHVDAKYIIEKTVLQN